MFKCACEGVYEAGRKDGYDEGFDVGRGDMLEKFARNILEHLTDIRWAIEESIRGVRFHQDKLAPLHLPADAVLKDLDDLRNHVEHLQRRHG